ncbi:MAG: NAD(P)/FAD-dependent oxidoreductase [Desulfosporosinus sp.]|jgi:predicted Rossmann fold flavoprotein
MPAEKKHVLIIGGGASGMMAAITAARKGVAVSLLERNSRIGKKILATGNGRCNFTNINAALSCYQGHNPGFASGALASFNVQKTLDFFHKLGVTAKVEEHGKVFPMSDQASSVLDVLRYEIHTCGVQVICDAFVKSIIRKNKAVSNSSNNTFNHAFTVQLENGDEFSGHKVILAAGGKAMPSSGSDGNAYQLAERLGHSLTPIFPALVQLKLAGSFFKQIEGVKLVGTAEIIHNLKTIAQDSGDILFANYGVSGPPILQISRKAGELLQKNEKVILKLNILDKLSKEELKEHLSQRFQNSPQKTLEFSLVGLINKRLIPVLLKEAGLKDLKRPVCNVSAKEREQILNILQDWRFIIRGTKSWSSAQVTAGGIAVNEINPYTMESKLVPGLFFAGEIVDIDGLCGGFNLQWAWSSGFLAGLNATLS